MSGETADPVAWLRTAILARKAIAEAATQAPWEPEGDDPTDDEVWIDVDGEEWRFIICRGLQSHENMLHVAANDPRAVIADCDADLAILGEHHILTKEEAGRCGNFEQFCITGPGDSGCVTCHYQSRGAVHGYGICRTVRALLGAYRFREGWRKEWAALLPQGLVV